MQYCGVRTLCKTSKPDYFSLSFDYNICGDWLFLWSIRSDLIISWCIVSPTKHSELNFCQKNICGNSFGRKLFLQILQKLEPAKILCHTVVLPTKVNFVLALRAVYCDTRSSYDELLRKAKLTILGCRRLQDIAIIMYKAKYNICPPYIKDIFKLDKPHYGFRNSGDFFIPRYNTTTYRSHSLRYVGPVIWSKLSKDVKNAESIYSFKKKIRKVDLEQVITEGCKNCFLCCT